MSSTAERLLPSAIKDGLHASSFIKEVLYYQKTESTNTIAKNLATDGAREGTVVITDEQTKGRGRLNRTWLSPANKNILMSVIFRPELEVSKIFSLTMLTSLAVVNGIKETTGLRSLIKWPNDIFIKDKKIGGILTEFNADHARVNFSIVGIGLNVNFNTLLYPEIKETATSLSVNLGGKISRVRLVQSILRHIDKAYNTLNNGNGLQIYKEWKTCSLIIGRRVKIMSSGKIEEGVAEFLHEDGRLILKCDDGKRKEILNGDVSLRLSQ
ncbi:MAG: biotin--[acetyl-CoA-carboxylase] ligase [Thermodesulfobacteriota bacterium]|nr:biotin--[acetyl-CoA-carboxylase] ligase [Thermodesulfobacteriota bacterium]